MSKRKQKHPVPSTSEGWFDYLVANGWRESYRCPTTGQSLWADPLGSDAPAEKRVIKTLKNKKTGNMETLEQYVAPIRPWNYPTHEAVEIQRLRDLQEEPQPVAAGKPKPVPVMDDDDFEFEEGE